MQKIGFILYNQNKKSYTILNQLLSKPGSRKVVGPLFYDELVYNTRISARINFNN